MLLFWISEIVIFDIRNSSLDIRNSCVIIIVDPKYIVRCHKFLNE